MTRVHRRRHLLLWVLLTPILALVLAGALRARAHAHAALQAPAGVVP